MPPAWTAIIALTALLPGCGAPAAPGQPLSRPARVPAGPAGPAGIEAPVLADLRERGAAPVLVLLAEQADLRAAAGLADAEARGRYVYETLRAHAERSQAGIREVLQTRGVPLQPFWVANAVAAVADADTVAALAARPDVRRIESNREQRWVPAAPAALEGPTAERDETRSAIGWGVSSINAPQVWDLGFTGQGIVIGNADTGMQWDHPALRSRYRGWDGSAARHDHNWHDAVHDSRGNPCGNDAAAPCDDSAHGTHTTGIAAGDDGAGHRVGVAPGARWIGCRNMDRGVGTPARYLECFQFFVAPTDLAGNDPQPALRPHVVNNSWGCPGPEGCGVATLQAAVENTQAAGIFVEVSAGNAGPGCGSISAPPALYDASFTTGAHDEEGRLAGFSSRGAVTADGSNRRKPDLVAPRREGAVQRARRRLPGL